MKKKSLSLILCIFLTYVLFGQSSGSWGICEFPTVLALNAYDPSTSVFHCKKVYVQATDQHYKWNGSAWVLENSEVDNIYNTNGTLTADRIVEGDSNSLMFEGLDSLGVRGNDIELDASNNLRLLADGNIEFELDNTDGKGLYIAADGDIGLGTSSPDARLDVEGGSVRFSDYGSGSLTGTEAYILGVDADGDVIELDIENGYTIFNVWAEESASIATSGATEWAFGNGDDTPAGHGVVIPVDCQLFAMGLDHEGGANTTVRIIKNSDTSLASYQVSTSSSENTFTTFGTPLSFAAGDIVNFSTISASTGGSSGRVSAWFRLRSTPASTSLVNDLLDVSAASITSGQILEYNGTTFVPVDLNADIVSYDNSTSGLTATDVQAAIDEMVISSNNIYTTNGTLGADRTVTMGGNNLTFDGTEDVIIQDDGDVGIGTTTPDARLDVEGGSVRFSDYGSGSLTGTETYILGVDADGDVIELDIENGYTIFNVWAEENANLEASGATEWSFGNGDETPAGHGMVIPFDCQLFAMGLDHEGGANTTVRIIKNSDTSLASYQVSTSSSENAFTTFGTPLSFSAGDIVNFSTISASTGGNSGRVSAWFRLRSTPASTSLVNDLLDVSAASITSGQILEYNGTSFVPVDLSADNVTYDNSTSGLTAADVQAAIDEMANGSNIYTMDGTLGADRAVNMDGYDLTFDGTEDVIIQDDGDVGIGTTTPDARLDVEGGSVRFSDYGSGSLTGTETYILGVDADGDVIELDIENGYTIFNVWAEENANLEASGATEWSFGNGDETPAGHGMVIPVDCQLFAMGLDHEGGANTTVRIIKNSDTSLASYQVSTSSSENAFTTFGTPLSFSAGDIVNFSTISASTGGNSGRVSAWFRLRSTPASTSLVNDLLDVSAASITSGQILEYNGTSFVPVDLNADNVSYDNSTSGLTATDVQAAIDEVAISSDNIYTTNGTLGADRTVTMNGNDLTFDGTEDVIIQDDGDVGIGTNAPNQKLDVRGTIIGAVPCMAVAICTDDSESSDDDIMGIIVASQPSTNKVYVKSIQDVSASSAFNLQQESEYTNGAGGAWNDFGDPSGGAAGYIMDISVSLEFGGSADENDFGGVISVRWSDGTIYMLSTDSNTINDDAIDDLSNWGASWDSWNGPGM